MKFIDLITKVDDLIKILRNHCKIEEIKNYFGEGIVIDTFSLNKEQGVQTFHATHNIILYVKKGIVIDTFSLNKEQGVQTFHATHNIILYVKKGKLPFCDMYLDSSISPSEVNPDYIRIQTHLIGCGEPYVVRENELFLYAAKQPCEVIIFQFKTTDTSQKFTTIPAFSDIKQEFINAAEQLDDYYFGYDERYAQVYAAGADLWESTQPNASLLLTMDKYHHLFSGKIIDLGCGEGRDSLYLARQGYQVTGVDVSKNALDKARNQAKDMGLNNIIFIESDVIYLRHIPDEHYDFALNMGCLHMLVKKSQRALHIQRVFKILKAGGKFLVDHCQQNWGRGFYSIPDYEKVVANLTPGNSIPRRIRINRKEENIHLKVLPYSEKKSHELIQEICQFGFHLINSQTSCTEAFGNSTVLLFEKP